LILGAPVTPADSCPNAAFRTGSSANLPDCRAYEQVTPVDKEASQDLFAEANTPNEAQTTDEGNRALLKTESVFGGNVSNLNNTYVFTRSATGWAMGSATPADAGDANYESDVFSPDLMRVAEITHTGSAVSSSPIRMALFGPVGGSYTTFGSFANGEEGAFVGASSDFSHVLLESQDHGLVPAAGGQVSGSHALYEWANGQLGLVNLTTGGSLTSRCGATLGNGHLYGVSHNAMSGDGSKIFFVSPDPYAENRSEPGCEEPTHLYMRVTTSVGGHEQSETVDVSAPEPGFTPKPGGIDANPFHPVGYVGADASGSRVFFMTETELTADDATYHDPELYEYDTETRKLVRVSRSVSGTAEGNLTAGGAIVSEDGSTIYFAAHGQLAPGAPVTSEEEENIYRYDTTSGMPASKATTYVATIKTTDFSGSSGFFPEHFIETSGPEPERVPVLNWSIGANALQTWNTTPDGRFLLFSSSRNLTGYDPNAGNPEGRIQELYRYDAMDGSVVCVSCLSNNAPASGSAEFAAQSHTMDTVNDRPPRSISNDGNRVFFDSQDQLVTQDTNHVRDVYEWEQEGIGTCPSGQLNGCVYLMSSGKDSFNSIFLDASSDGSNVFFGTHAPLASTDIDSSGDLYDARVDGGFPPPASLVACSGEDCRPPASTQPSVFGAPSSATFSGAGNITPPPPVVVKTKPKSKPAKCKKGVRHACKKKHRAKKGSVRKHPVRK
jgi:hypothetical protein